MMQNKFTEIIKHHEINYKKNKFMFNTLGYTKLATILILVYFIYLTFINLFPLYLIITNLSLITVFIVLSFYQDYIHEKVLYAKGIMYINKKNLDRLNGKWTSFNDIGEEFININHHYSSDLDIVGKKSLFQFLNSTHTYHGRITFANDLLNQSYSKDEIIKRQEAVKELSMEMEYSNHIEYYLSKIGTDHSTKKLLNDLQDNQKYMNNAILRNILGYLPLFTLAFISIIFILELEYLYLVTYIIITLQTLLWVSSVIKLQSYLGTISRLPYRLGAYSKVIEILKTKTFQSNKLKDLQKQFCAKDVSVSKAIKELAAISNMISVKNNALIYFVMNALLLWDFQCVFRLEKWKEKYSHLAENWFIALGEFESLLSFSKLAYVSNNASLPNILDSHKKISAKNIGHPLLNNETRVNNDFTFDNNIFIISGSNMSGKTTFLRTVGINLVLAQGGGFVIAEDMSCSIFSIVTSMRIADDLNEGISTFYAELKRIKEIITYASVKTNLLFLIDEIFKGTNSIDRLSGARTVISKLNHLHAVGIITTHDLELCELEKEHNNIGNYSFSEHYSDNNIFFDYKIKLGKSTTTNAKYLMKMIGIL